MIRDIKPSDLQVGDYCDARIPHLNDPEKWSVRNALVVDTHGPLIQVTTATRKIPVAIRRIDVVGLGWRKA